MDPDIKQQPCPPPEQSPPAMPGELLPPMVSYTSNMEDVLLRRCFMDLPSGFYIDIGAHHPTNASVTRWLYDQGWSGINIEPGEGIDALRSERTRDINLQIAITDRIGEATFWVHSGNPGTSSLAQDAPSSVLDLAGEVTPVTVATETLESIFDKYCSDRLVNFVKIDAEGAEDLIIRSTDWLAYRPELLVIESTEPYSTIRRAESWPEHLEKCRYAQVYFDGINDYWLREESMHRASAFKVPVNVLDHFSFYDPEKEGLRLQARALQEMVNSMQETIAGFQGGNSANPAHPGIGEQSKGSLLSWRLPRNTGIVAAIRRILGITR